jgi:hypothetical protein
VVFGPGVAKGSSRELDPIYRQMAAPGVSEVSPIPIPGSLFVSKEFWILQATPVVRTEGEV